MKLLFSFVVLCATLLGVIAWLLTPRGDAAREIAPPLTPASDPAHAVGETDNSGHVEAPRSPEPTTAAATPAQSAVKWAGGPANHPAARRLTLALETLRTDPEHPTALRDLAAALAELGRWSEVADVLTRLREQSPDDLELRFALATALMQARRWVATITELRVVVAAQPEHDRAWFNLAVAQQAVGHLADARAAWDRVLTLKPSADAHARRGEVLLDLHEWAAAADDFAAVLREQPDAEDAVLNRALALVQIDGHAQASRELVAFATSHACCVAVLNRLGELAWTAYKASPEEQTAEREEALRRWRESLACDPTQADIRAAVGSE